MTSVFDADVFLVKNHLKSKLSCSGIVFLDYYGHGRGHMHMYSCLVLDETEQKIAIHAEDFLSLCSVVLC